MTSGNFARAQSEVLGAWEGTSWVIFSYRRGVLSTGLCGHDGDVLLDRWDEVFRGHKARVCVCVCVWDVLHAWRSLNRHWAVV